MRTERQRRILASLTPCAVFGDVGCDHGWLTEAMLSSGKANRAVYSDISQKCLKKAERLLAPFGTKAKGVVCDGISKEHAPCDQILIAGMGGIEIIHILNDAPVLPKRLVIQPMKDAEAVRRALDGLGYFFIEDTIFAAEGKYYFLMAAEGIPERKNGYSDLEFKYGRGSLADLPPVFIEVLRTRKAELSAAMEKAKEKEPLKKEYTEIEEILRRATE